jgi:hypothetical protein
VSRKTGVLAAALFLAAAAYGLEHASRTLFGPIAAQVNVRWLPDLEAPQREALERRFSLTRGAPVEGTTYTYLLTDTSSSNIRELVRHPSVLDTHHIDRAAFTLADSAVPIVVSGPDAQRRSRQAASMATAGWILAAGIAVLWVLVVSAPARMQQLGGILAAALHRMRDAVYRGIPEVSPQAAALFRILFMGTLVVFFFISPIGSGGVPTGPQATDTPWAMRVAGDVFISWPRLADLVGPWLLISGLLTVAGAFTRVSFAAFAVGAIAWGVLHSLRFGHHPVSALLVALLCLIPSRWGDAWSIDALRRRHPSAAGAREYGYTVWIPGVVLGVALAAAAVSKLREGGIGWILNGTVKYHFLTDAEQAPVDWGLRFGLEPGTAIALSFGAIAIEMLVLPIALFGPPWARLVAAAGTGAMFAGFWFFQGLYWPWWWILTLAFVPWHRVLVRDDRGASLVRLAARTRQGSRHITLRHVQAACIAVVMAQQIVASAWRLEIPPILSAYDMYSTTYASPEEYTRQTTSYALVVTMADGSVRECGISEEEAEHPALDNALARCVPGETDRIRTAGVEATKREVDWKTGRFLGMVRQPVRTEPR